MDYGTLIAAEVSDQLLIQCKMLLLLLVNLLKYTLQTKAAITHTVLMLLDYVENRVGPLLDEH